MILKKIKLKNIRSYEETEIEFSEGSTLLSGDIGAGKTSILLGIEFALFGLQPGQKGSSLLRNGANEGGAVILFEVDGREVLIERTLKRGKSISQDYSAITLDGEKKEIAVTELKALVLDLLNYPKEFSRKQNILYKFTVYTPQEEMKQIILQDSETRTNTLRHVFGIDKYKRLLENTAILTAKLREEKRMLEGMTLNLESDKLEIFSKEEKLKHKINGISTIEGELLAKKQARKNIESGMEEISKKIEEKNKLNQEVEKTKIIITNKNDLIIDNIKLLSRLKLEIEEFNKLNFNPEEILQIEKEIELKRNGHEKLGDNSLEINSQINSLKIKNTEIETMERKFSNLETCPTCFQTVDAVYRANVLNNSRNNFNANKRKIDELEEEKKIVLDKIRNLSIEIQNKERKLTDLKILKMRKEGIYEKQQRYEEIKMNNINLNKDIELLKRHTEALRNSMLELSRFDNLYNEKKIELDSAFKSEKIVEIKIAEVKKEIEVFSSQIQELKTKISEVEKLKEKLIFIINLEDWLNKKFIPMISFIEKNVMLKLKHEFSQFFAKWFCMLVSDNFNVSLKDDFTPIIEQQDYELDYAYLSGGERTAVALAYRLALNQVINSVLSKIKTKDLVILDEPTDGFSEQQLDKMREVLEQLNVKQLIIVSHEQKIEGFVENIMRIQKNHGVSEKE
ncbi:MAG: AAA family ATPase [Candidatus Pacearchaeota archaeon]|nr:AAA family ATPase [Candidatus Pacearchaeota archaeon]